MGTGKSKRTTSGPHKPVLLLCDLDSDRRSADETEARRLHAHAIAAIEGSRSSPGLHQRLTDYADLVLDGHLGMLRRVERGDAVWAHLRGERSWSSFRSQRQAAAALLRETWAALHPPAPRPDGYTSSNLKNLAGIKRTTWQRICKVAEIKVDQGDATREFSNGEVRRLAEAARSIDTPKTRGAAEAWEQAFADWDSFASTA